MKARTLLGLAVILAVLVLVAVIQHHPPTRPVAAGGVQVGRTLFPSLDVNAVAGFELRDRTNTVRLARQDGRWVVATLWNHPADFEKLADNLRTLANLKAGEVLAGGDQYLKDCGLTATSNKMPLQVRLNDAAGKELAALTVGLARLRGQNSEYGGYPDGCYIRAGSGPVVLVKDNLSDWPRQSFAWVKARLLEITRDEVLQLKGSVSNQTWMLAYSNSTFKLEGISTNEELNTETTESLASALAWLDATGVADPARQEAELGLGQPPTLEVTTRSGLNYTLKAGTNAPAGRYVRLAVSYLQPGAPTNFVTALAAATNAAASNQVTTLKKKYEAKVAADTKKAQEKNALFNRFVYIVSDDACRKLLPARSELAKLRPPPPPVTNTVSTATNDVSPATPATPETSEK